MRRIGAFTLLLMVTACGGGRGDRTPASAYRNWEDRIVVATGLANLGLALPCVSKVTVNGATVKESIPTDQCYRMTEPKRWQGVWVDEFEGSRFCPGERFACSYRGPSRDIWFSPAPNVLDDEKVAGNGDRYLVDFIGRRTLYAGSYGHMGMFDQEMIMDRLISIKALKGPKEKVAANK